MEEIVYKPSDSFGSMSEQKFLKDEDLTEQVEYFEGKIKLGKQLDQSQRNALMALLSEYRNAFALRPDEIGFTHKFVHTIDTGDSKPITTVPYRVSPEKRKITNQLVQELLDAAVIKPSCSPWASPIVLVKKKTGDFRFR